MKYRYKIGLFTEEEVEEFKDNINKAVNGFNNTYNFYKREDVLDFLTKTEKADIFAFMFIDTKYKKVLVINLTDVISIGGDFTLVDIFNELEKQLKDALSIKKEV